MTRAHLAECGLRHAPPWALEWMTDRSGYVPLPDAAGIIASAGGHTQGVVVFDGFTETMAQVHIALASPSAVLRLARAAAEYVFQQRGLRVLVTMLSEQNQRAVRLARGLEFRESCRIVDGMSPGVDLLLFELRREWCRYLKEKH